MLEAKDLPQCELSKYLENRIALGLQKEREARAAKVGGFVRTCALLSLSVCVCVCVCVCARLRVHLTLEGIGCSDDGKRDSRQQVRAANAL